MRSRTARDQQPEMSVRTGGMDEETETTYALGTEVTFVTLGIPSCRCRKHVCSF